MSIRIDGTNTTANPGITGGDADTGLQFGTDEISIVTGGVERAKVDDVGRFDVNSGSSGVISAKQNTNNGGFNIYEGKDSTGSTKFYVSHNGRVGAAEGVIFGTDTAAVNVLDDYEEGTWTAIVRNYSSLPTFTTSPPNTTGYYVKVGNLCTVYYYSSNFTVSANGTGAAIISGLPFLSANVSQGYIAATFTHSNCFISQIQNGYINPGDSFVVPIVQGGTSGTSWVTGSTVSLMFSLTYRTEP